MYSFYHQIWLLIALIYTIPTPHPHERRRVPVNVYYSMPYYAHFFFIYSVGGSFFCAKFSDYMSTVASAALWIIFGASCLVLYSPAFHVERKKLDEEGNEVTLRCPLIGFRACEVYLDVEGINKGLYDPEDSDIDRRLHDGYRHGPALLRI